jgi:hypothetical protein
MVIPALRIITADRKIREAARVVESAFSVARDDAIVRGFAGVEITKEGIYRLRALPPYAGDTDGDAATVSGTGPTFTVTFPPGLSYVPNIKINEYIKFNHRGPLYRITDIPPSTPPNSIEITAAPHQPYPPTTTLPFQIFRQPARIESSLVSLPARHYIDWEFSGDPDNELGAPLGAPTMALSKIMGFGESLRVIFNKSGGIDYLQDAASPTPNILFPTGPLYLLIAEDSTLFDETSGRGNLDNPSNLWVTVGHTNGAVFVSEMAASSPPNSNVRIAAARALAKNRFTANQ